MSKDNGLDLLGLYTRANKAYEDGSKASPNKRRSRSTFVVSYMIVGTVRHFINRYPSAANQDSQKKL